MFRNKKRKQSIKNSMKGYFEEINLKQEAKNVWRANKFRVKEDEANLQRRKFYFVLEQRCMKIECKRQK